MCGSLAQVRLDGKVAIVTGAGGRGNSIGRAYAIGLAQAGASVVVADLSGDGAQRVSDEISAAGGKAIAVQVDITQPDSVATMVAAATTTYGGVDILVNNAALMAELKSQSAVDVPLAAWNRILDVNLTGALNRSEEHTP